MGRGRRLLHRDHKTIEIGADDGAYGTAGQRKLGPVLVLEQDNLRALDHRYADSARRKLSDNIDLAVGKRAGHKSGYRHSQYFILNIDKLKHPIV